MKAMARLLWLVVLILPMILLLPIGIICIALGLAEGGRYD